MSIKSTLLSECSNYSRTPSRSNTIVNVEKILKSNSLRYLSNRGRVNSRHPIYLLIKAIRKHFIIGKTKEEFLSTVFSEYQTIVKESGLLNNNAVGITDVGNFFNDNSLTTLIAMRTYPTELSDDDSYLHIISNENKSLLGIAPTESLDTMQNITSIVIDVLTLSRVFYQRYLAGLEYNLSASEIEENADNQGLLDYVIWGLITSDCVMEYHRRSMFNRYMAIGAGDMLSIEKVDTPFIVPDYVPQLNRYQVQVWNGVGLGDWRTAFSLLTLSENYTVLDLLTKEASLPLPINFSWVEVINELQWAELYKALGGDRRGVDSVVARYIRDLKQDSVLEKCEDKVIREYIESRIDFIKVIFSIA